MIGIAITFTNGYWATQDYERHIYWWRKREEENHVLYFANSEIAMRKDYWAKLEAWAEADVDGTLARRALLNEHKQRIQQITAKMVLTDLN